MQGGYHVIKETTVSDKWNRMSWPEWVATATLLASVIALAGWSNAAQQLQQIMQI